MSELVGKWNYYFLRYGAGTIIGAALIWLVANHGEMIGCSFFQNLLPKNSIGAAEFGGTTVLATLGFAFCYIASAPGLVFHCSRGVVGSDNKVKLFCVIGLPFILSAIATWTFLKFFTCEIPKIFSCNSYIFGISLTAFCAVMLWQIFLIITVIFSPEENRKFYKELTEKRVPDDKIKEYVESYRHIREHANAFEIIFLEIVLASTLISFPHFSWVILTFWILPSAFCWIVGTMLEKRIG